uniref:Transmembrane protein n=1 Tax=Quercus lobata TaxID=97700 RepID=A0A7N2REX1_QUELO
MNVLFDKNQTMGKGLLPPCSFLMLSYQIPDCVSSKADFGMDLAISTRTELDPIDMLVVVSISTSESVTIIAQLLVFGSTREIALLVNEIMCFVSMVVALFSINSGTRRLGSSSVTNTRVVRTGVPRAQGGRGNAALIRVPFLFIILGTVALGGLNATRAYKKEKAAYPSHNPFLP